MGGKLPKKRTDWEQVAAGAAIIAFSILDVVPGDELILIPAGIGMIGKGFRFF